MKFCFHSGYKNVKGGYTTLIICLIRELIDQNQKVILFNYSDGLIAQELHEQVLKIQIIDLSAVDWLTVDEYVQPDDVFIIVRFEECFRYLFKINPKMVYYDINDNIDKISSYKWRMRFSSLGKSLTQKLLESKSLIFMDDTGIFNVKSAFSLSIKNPILLPIPVTTNDHNLYLDKKCINPKEIRLTYVGRSVDWKMFPLKKILTDCANLTIEKKIKFSIVVDSLEIFNNYIQLEKYQLNPKLVIEVFENLNPSELKNFLLQKADIHFAMGTAALDAANLGIPTVLVDYSTKDLKTDYTYNWLFNAKNNSLGRNLDKRASENGMTMEELLITISDNTDSITQLSGKSFDYVRNFHSGDKIVKKLIDICKDAEFRFIESKPFIPYYSKFHLLARKIFMKNE